ncbi:hypothetical protein NCCP2222_32620 [Sporosarcina sp. NCCP-2222]|nr:hypothetical protein NCCP2222_32620 [Sporosarcina sp. NCCP-2222]
MIPTPALAYPAKVVATELPIVEIENTSNNLVCAATPIFKFVVSPLTMFPIEIVPARVGDSSTNAFGMGVKILLGVGDW